jgi:hypothetical protein
MAAGFDAANREVQSADLLQKSLMRDASCGAPASRHLVVTRPLEAEVFDPGQDIPRRDRPELWR